jgi:hypothetical protein
MAYLPGLIQIRPQYSDVEDTVHENVTWWIQPTRTTNLTSAQLTNIQTIFDENWYFLWKNIGAAGNDYLGSYIQDFNSATGLEVPNTAYTPQAGVHPTQESAQVALLISLQELNRYRGGHGRWYIPCTSVEASADSKTWSTGTVNQAVTAMNQLVVTMSAVSAGNGGAVNPVVLHTKKKGDESFVPYAGALSDFIVNTEKATQRRRLRKVARRR